MKIQFDYPAIVSGDQNPDGSIRHDLVRVPDWFEIKEVSDADLPPSFEVVDNTRSNAENNIYRFADGKHFKPFIIGHLHNLQIEGSVFQDTLLTGRGVEFQCLKDVVRSQISPLKIWEVNNTERRVTTREQLRGLDSSMVAILKAPYLKNWKWLSADVEKETAFWKGRVQDIFDRFRIIDDVLYVETHEPCYEVQHASYGGRRERFGKISLGSKETLGATLKPLLIDPKTGFEVWQPMVTLLGKALFPADGLAQIHEFIEEAKWSCYEKLDKEIVVHNNDAVSQDFMELETMRIARAVHEFGAMMERTAEGRDGQSTYKNNTIDLGKFKALQEELRTSIVQWQSEKQDTTKVERSMMGVFDEMTYWERGQDLRRYNDFILPDQIDALNVMRDQTDISLDHDRWKPKSLIS